ncbi:MAG: OmpH family outer membrane protein [Pseudomonadota bacterium]
MTMKTKLLAAALCGVTALSAAPAAAQVNGIATTDPATVIAVSQARQTAYQQIETTYAAQLQSRQQKEQQAEQLTQQLTQQLDTDGNGQLSEQERAAAQNSSNPLLGQIQTLRTEIDGLERPILRAQLYVIQQIAAQFPAAQQQVISDKSISMILSPESLIYSAPGMNITNDVVTALNTRLPAVSTAVPADWQPSRQVQQLFQQVQQILVLAQLQQRAQQQQQQQQQQQTTQQPTGR